MLRKMVILCSYVANAQFVASEEKLHWCSYFPKHSNAKAQIVVSHSHLLFLPQP